jgi:hypothetical protein
MLPFGVTIPATVPQVSEMPEGLMNNPVQSVCTVTFCMILRQDVYSDQKAQTTTAPLMSHFINFKNCMYLFSYIDVFYYILYCNKLLLIIYKII